MHVGTMEEIIDDNHAIVSSSNGPEYYVSIMSFVDKDELQPGSSVLLHNKACCVGRSVALPSPPSATRRASPALSRPPREGWPPIQRCRPMFLRARSDAQNVRPHTHVAGELDRRYPRQQRGPNGQRHEGREGAPGVVR